MHTLRANRAGWAVADNVCGRDVKLPGIVGTLQATEAIKWILGKGEPLVGRLLLFDALQMRFREMRLRVGSACSCEMGLAAIADGSERLLYSHPLLDLESGRASVRLNALPTGY